MKVTEIKYEIKVNTGNYEHEVMGVTVHAEEEDNIKSDMVPSIFKKLRKVTVASRVVAPAKQASTAEVKPVADSKQEVIY